MALIAPAHRFFRDLTPELSTSHNAASAKINEKDIIVIREKKSTHVLRLQAKFILSSFLFHGNDMKHLGVH